MNTVDRCSTEVLHIGHQREELDIELEGKKLRGTVSCTSVLGPILFLLYINDINENVQSSIRLFADDSIIYRKINSNIDHPILQTDLLQLEKWSDK